MSECAKHPNNYVLGGARKVLQSKLDYDSTLIKRLSNLGHGNRDEVARLISEGRVCVNGIVASNFSLDVSYSDKISIDGKVITNKKVPIEILLFHKPTKCITTKFDPEGRCTIFDLLPKKYQHFVTVGRLDFNTSGLLLLTNIGSIAHELESPKTKISRVYRVKVKGSIKQDSLRKLEHGIMFEGVKYNRCTVKCIRKISSDTSLLKVVIFEGKNQEVRNIMRSQNLFVVKLERISYGPYRLGSMPVGAIAKSVVLHKSTYV